MSVSGDNKNNNIPNCVSLSINAFQSTTPFLVSPPSQNDTSLRLYKKERCLVSYSATLKFLNHSEVTLKNCLPSSKTQKSRERILGTLCAIMQKASSPVPAQTDSCQQLLWEKNILLTTPFLQWYLCHGLHVTNIQQTVEYRPKRCFQAFGDTVCMARRQGDQDPSKAILADTFKLLGNSAYGKTLTNLAKHCHVRYVDDKGTQNLINEPLFRKLTPLTEEVTEVESAKATINWNLPLQIGFFVYQYAKLRMLQFYYDFADQFVSRSDYQLCEMDTDSLYMALSTPTLEQAVHPTLLPRFYKEYHHWFPSQACDVHQVDFVSTRLAQQPLTPPTCYLQRQKIDKRTPGLLKVEFESEGIVALCSKTYYCFGNTTDKQSCKGLNKRLNDLTKDHYLKVLKTQTSGGGLNRGFRTDGKTIPTDP